MELRDLHYLTAAADAGKFAIVARALDVEISTISRRIGKLEDELGLSLFERDRSGLRLTPGGRSVLRCVQVILTQIEDVKRIGQQFASGTTGELRIGVRIPPIGSVMAKLLKQWHAACPDVTLTLVEGNERELALGLSERRLDVAVVGGRTMWPHVSAVTLYRERMIAVLPADHPLSNEPRVGWKALSTESVLVQGWTDNHTQREFYATLLGNDAKFHEHTASKQTIMSLVRAGFGITLATQSQAEADFPGVAFRMVDEENAWLEFCLVWLPEIENPLVGRFVAFMRDETQAGDSATDRS
jgi:DNA-binding transcriptional LysR family regulator